jgi:hypothetical protein
MCARAAPDACQRDRPTGGGDAVIATAPAARTEGGRSPPWRWCATARGGADLGEVRWLPASMRSRTVPSRARRVGWRPAARRGAPRAPVPSNRSTCRTSPPRHRPPAVADAGVVRSVDRNTPCAGHDRGAVADAFDRGGRARRCGAG